MIARMRAVAVYLTLLILLAISFGAGYIAADWPRWCSRAHWCAPDWPPRLMLRQVGIRSIQRLR